jgi:hypothetical protein
MNAIGAYRKYVFNPAKPTRMEGLFGLNTWIQPNTKLIIKTFLIGPTPGGEGWVLWLFKINPK